MCRAGLGFASSVLPDEHWLCRNITKFSDVELDAAIDKLKAKRSCDAAGVCAEMFKASGPKFKQVILDLFNDILQMDATIPEEWKLARIRVLYKKGDIQLPGNYRPITLLTILYKLFAIMVAGRIDEQLQIEQPVEQAGFRPGFSTDDHLFSVVMLQEKSAEFQLPLWFGAVDYQK
eukprot:7023685-Karenia_brevis.AAC.1